MDKNEIISRIGYFRTKAKLSQKALSIEIDMNIGYINTVSADCIHATGVIGTYFNLLPKIGQWRRLFPFS